MPRRVWPSAAVAILAASALVGCGATDTTKSVASESDSSSSAADEASSSSSTSSSASSSSSTSSSEPEAEEEPQDETQDLALGSTITVSGTSGDAPYEMTVNVGKAKTSTSALVDFGEKPTGSYVGFPITYECTSGSCDYNPFDWTIRSEDGEEFDPSFVDTFDPTLDSGTLREGRKAKGYITYDLPAGEYFIEYTVSLWDDESASWVYTVK